MSIVIPLAPRTSTTPSGTAGATKYIWTTNGSGARTPCTGSCRTPQPPSRSGIGHPRGGRGRAGPCPQVLSASPSAVCLQPAPVSPVSLDPAPIRPVSLRPAPISPVSLRPGPISPVSLRPAPNSRPRTPSRRPLKRRPSLKRRAAPHTRPRTTSLRPAAKRRPTTTRQPPSCQNPSCQRRARPSTRQSLLARPGIPMSGRFHVAERSSCWPSMPLAVQQALADPAPQAARPPEHRFWTSRCLEKIMVIAIAMPISSRSPSPPVTQLSNMDQLWINYRSIMRQSWVNCGLIIGQFVVNSV